jgi:hypothetical protein
MKLDDTLPEETVCIFEFVFQLVNLVGTVVQLFQLILVPMPLNSFSPSLTTLQNKLEGLVYQACLIFVGKDWTIKLSTPKCIELVGLSRLVTSTKIQSQGV